MARGGAITRAANAAQPRTRTRIVQAARRGGRAVARRAWERKQLLGAMGIGAVLGYMERNAVAVPTLGPLGRDGTIALVLIGLDMVSPGPWLNALASGAAACATKGMMTSPTVSGDEDEGGV
jgi:hypothetical protein